MLRASMVNAVAQASVLNFITFLAAEVLYKRAFDKFEASLSNASAIETVSSNATVSTTSNSIVSAEGTDSSNEAASTNAGRAREAVIIVVVCIIAYYWNVWLERTFPARSTAPTFTTEVKSDKVEVDEQVEEEIIKKWIAQGKVKRASLDWGNTLIKWVLDMSIGLAAPEVIRSILRKSLRLRSPFSLGWHGLSRDILMGLVGGWFSISPLTTFIGFVIIPAGKRIVLDAAAGLSWTVFFSTSIGLFVPWMMEKAQEMQAAAANMTANGTAAVGKEL